MEFQHPAATAWQNSVRSCLRRFEVHSPADTARSEPGSGTGSRRHSIASALSAVRTFHRHCGSRELKLLGARDQGRETSLERIDVPQFLHLQQVDERPTGNLLQRALAAELL